MYQPNLRLAEGQNMKSGAISALIEFLCMPDRFVRTHAGPTPIMNSTFLEMSHGFLNRRSVSHSVECRANCGVTPTSSSSQRLIGVNSTATVGPRLDPPPFTFQFPTPPSKRWLELEVGVKIGRAHV